MTVRICFLCKTGRVSEALDFGPQPICNRYLVDSANEEFRHPMVIGQCEACGLLQIPEAVPSGELKPRVDGVTYVEPEGHLDRLAEILSGLPGLTRTSTFCGLSFKDDSLLRRMRERGFSKTWGIDPDGDLGIGDSRAGIETLQDRFDPEVARRLTRTHGRPDVVVARHILEHAHNLTRFAGGLKELVKPEGYIVIELPDCSRALERGDCTTIWEEHVLYFTRETFQRAFAFCGFELSRFERFPYPLEDSLVGIAQPVQQPTPSFPSREILQEERKRADLFLRGMDSQRDRFKRILSGERRRGRKVALLGAGHLSCAFINLLDLKDDIDFVVDGDPHKRGLRMPGSRLLIYDSGALLEEKVGLCLLGVNPANQAKVIQRHQEFLKGGGSFLSIFPAEGRESVLQSFPEKVEASP